MFAYEQGRLSNALVRRIDLFEAKETRERFQKHVKSSPPLMFITMQHGTKRWIIPESTTKPEPSTDCDHQ